MKPLHWKSALMLLPSLLASCAPALQPEGEGSRDPALLVMISVDQLRADLLTRYDEYFTGGFRRLADEGAYFTAVHDHAGSQTGPGHATLSTGVFPAHSGIVANDWTERQGGESVGMYNVGDASSPIVGHPRMDGVSPRNLLHTGVADWVRSKDADAVVVSISGKDRAAILMAGKSKGEVYWWNQDVGGFITSAYYQSEYPEWVSDFNERVLPTLLDSVWTETSPLAARGLARPDTASYEGDGVHTYFPHRFTDEEDSFFHWVDDTPFVDAAVLKLIEAAVPETGLGADSITDFLAVGLSQTDHVGHSYGPLSREQLDNLIRLDQELGDFFDFLDAHVGEGRWIAVLSADHGSTTMPEWRATHGQPGYRMNGEDRDAIARIAELAAAAAPSGERSEAVASAVRNLPFVADAYTFDELGGNGAPRDSFVTLFRHSYSPTRVAADLSDYGVDIRLTEGTYSGGETGTGHGSAYVYDRVVPLIFMGGAIRPARIDELARTVDLAPTLASLGGATPPDDLDGHALRVPLE